jgi:hypothetical protein
MLSEKKKIKRKTWGKKWYLKRNISCDAHLLNELIEKDVPWDYAIVVSAGELRKLWDSLSELRSSLCERRLKRTVLRPALLPVKTAQFIQFFRQVWRPTVKSFSLTESVEALIGSTYSYYYKHYHHHHHRYHYWWVASETSCRLCKRGKLNTFLKTATIH